VLLHDTMIKNINNSDNFFIIFFFIKGSKTYDSNFIDSIILPILRPK